ncbi:hypothetical protein [Clavibacter nebraskensis]|nr:hypothetical protein [Clavibacter nebraskensis]QGV65971.2 hypothetical protein EGX36_03455 [Clavibacter nebraskensis]QGV68769.2 hypothetical protein EGX37_03440 [Clavibacter nebraskensis]QGV71559.2 hypothetical protein EGX35_03440 [Clavibacter nebraskensis]
MDQMAFDGSWIGSSGWLTLALVNAGLAEQKGRSRWNWFLVSIVLGPIATFFIVTWERVPAKGSAPHPLEAPTNGLLAVGVGLAALAVVSAVVAGIGGDTGLWVLAAALAVAGTASLVLHVLAHRRWAALQAARVRTPEVRPDAQP